MSGDKTEQATPKRLRDARERGDIPTSPEMTAAVLGVVGIVALQQQGGQLVQGLMSLLARDILATSDPSKFTGTTISAQLRSDVATGLLLLLPLTVAMMVGAAVIGFLNTRGLLSLKTLTPSFRKLNPINGVKHLFGKEALVQLLKTLAKLAVALVILRGWMSTWQNLLPLLPFMDVGAATTTLWQDTVQIALQITGAFFIIGAVDFGYRQFAWRKRLRMSKHDVKEEFKSAEGNPQMRARMRSLGRRRLKSLASGGGIKQVPQADVVITNPTHYAIAIQYKAGKMRAPRVIAKGQRLFALRIKEMARQHNIPIVENKPLAQALFKSVEVNQEIPGDLYQAVAQVLAFVFRLRNAPRLPRRRAPSGTRTAGRMAT